MNALCRKKGVLYFFFLSLLYVAAMYNKKTMFSETCRRFSFKMRYFIEIIQFLVRGSRIATGKMGKKIIFRGSRNILVTHGT